MPSIAELIAQIAACEAELATVVTQEGQAEAAVQARLHEAAEQMRASDQDWAGWHILISHRSKLEETLSDLLRSLKDATAETRVDVMSEIEFLARFSEDMSTGDDEDVIVPRWLLKKLREDAQRLF